MSFRPSSLFERIRQPEHTGANRCLPCTAVNVGFSVIVALAVAQFSRLAGAGILVVCLAVISLRGYLVPGTPRLTERFLPASALRAFGKGHVESDSSGSDYTADSLNTAANSPAVEPVDVLESASIVEWEHGREDPSLVASFRTRWQSRIDELVDSSDQTRQALAAVTGTPAAELTFIETQEGVIAEFDGTWLGTWPSRAALVADVAAIPLLDAEHDEWSASGPGTRGAVLDALRTFLDACPVCDGTVATTDGRRSISCCRTTREARYRCVDCDATLVSRSLS